MNKEELFGASGQDNSTGFVSLEEIENAFRTPSQHQADYEQAAETTSPMNDLSHLADPEGLRFLEPEPVDAEPEETVSPEKAQRTGMRIARLVDTGIDFTLSNFVARNDESYKADECDLQDIADCWGELAQEKGWSIGPEWTLVILYIMVYGPLVKQAVADRRFAEHEARMNVIEAQMKTLQMSQSPTPSEKPDQDGVSTTTTDSPFNYRPQGGL